MIPKTADAVILGGGVMGASTAYHLARGGMKNVVLLEREAFFGTGATGRCAGGIRFQFNTEINIRLSQISLPMLDSFEEETGVAAMVKKCGYLFALTRETDVLAYKNAVELQNKLGVRTEWLEAEDVRRLAAPCRFDDAIAGCFNAEEGLADPHSVVSGYIDSARRLGAVCLTDCVATGIDTHGNRVRGVNTNRGNIGAGMVVNACGPWSAAPARWAGVELPVRPLRRQWFVTDALDFVPETFPFVIDFAQSLYFHREGQGLLTGMSNPDQQPGEDQRIDQEWEMFHIQAAIARMPQLETAGIRNRQAGLYEMTPDAHPVIGSTPVEGFYLLTGFSGHGFMQGPVCGKLMAEILIDGAASSLNIERLHYSRFAKHKIVPELNVI